MSTPSSLSEPVENGTAFKWLLTDEERLHIAEMLKIDGSSITLTGNVMNRDREICKSCGKPSGLDDLVQNALEHRIHTSQFMIDILQNGPKNNSPGHEVQCSKCGQKFAGIFGWIEVGLVWFRSDAS